MTRNQHMTAKLRDREDGTQQKANLISCKYNQVKNKAQYKSPFRFAIINTVYNFPIFQIS